MNHDTPLVKRAYNLGLKAVPNFLGLSAEQIAYYEQHLDEIPAALARGFVVPKATIEVVNGVTYIILPPTTGRTAEGFIRTWEKHYYPSEVAKYITRKARFTPTTGVIYRIPIIVGGEFTDKDRITSNIRAEAARRHYRTLPFEAACLLREAVSDEELERLGLLWLIGMHDSIEASDGYPGLLGVHRYDAGRRVDAQSDRPGNRWIRGGGFAFLADPDMQEQS